MKKTIWLTLIAAAAVITLAACGKSSNATTKSSPSPKIVAVGSTALQPLVEQAAAAYQQDHGDVKLTIQGGGSGTGLSQVAQGAVTIGNSDIFAEQADGVDAKTLVDHKVAVVGMAPVVNKDVDVTNLTLAQLRSIFTGKVKNWSALGGKNLAITVINRAAGSGTRATFEAAVMNGEKAATTQEQDSNGTVQQIVSQTPGAISYLAFSYLKSSLSAVSIDGVKPTAANVATNAWPIWSYEHMYTKGQPNAATKAFLTYMTSSSVQENLVPKLGYIPISAMKVQKDATGKVTK